MQTPAPSAPPAPPAIPGRVMVVGAPSSPTAVWRAAVAQRRELANQMEELSSQRSRIAEQLQDPTVTGANRKGLESRLVDLDGRISQTDGLLAAANAQVAATAAVPGAVVEEPRFVRNGPPREVYVLTALFFVVVLFPISVALARRIWRRGTAVVTALPQELMERFNRLDQAVDSIAVEVERIGEGQRFVTRLMGDRAKPDALPAERSRTV